jgi:hypothetical protein
MFTSLIYLNYLLVAVILAAMIWFILNQQNDVNNHHGKMAHGNGLGRHPDFDDFYHPPREENEDE